MGGNPIGVFLSLVLLLLAPSTVLGLKYNYTCKHRLPDNEIYDLNSFRKTSVPDYTFKDDNYLFVVNFCGPTIKRCGGLDGSFFSIWNVTSYDCIVDAGSEDPVATYIDHRNVFKGIRLTYTFGMSSTTIEVACDQAYDRAVFVRAERVHASYNLFFKSKLVCRNYAVPVTDKWSSTAVCLVLMLVAIVVYFGCGLYMNMRGGSYNSFADLFPNKECFLKIVLKAKELVNKAASTVTSQQTETVPDASVSSPSRS